MTTDYSGVEAAFGYAEDVLLGKINACGWVILACERHKRDLMRSENDASWPYRFDNAKAEKVIRFLELLPHVKGKWAKMHERMTLAPWQKFFVASIFGWVHRETGLRRFRRATLIVPRKNGKSMLAAGIGLYMLTGDGEHGAEVYCGATSERQAWEVFRPAQRMAERTLALRQAYGVTVHARKIERTKLGSFFEPVIGKPGDGASPHCAINDEYHEQQTDEMADTMLTGMGAREQPLMLDTTTAGNSLASPCYAHQKELEALLENSMQDDSLFGLIYTIDKDDDWSSEMALQKANPNMGISVTEEFLYAQQEAAIRNARHQNRFKTKHLDVWVTAREVFINIADWNRQTDTQLCEEMFEGEECWVGMDLSSKKDVTAVVKLFKRTINGDDHYYVITPKFYLPENTVNLPECEYYQGWVHDGFLNATHGNIIDFVQIREDIIALKEQFSIASVAYDPWGATQLAQELQDGHDIEVIEVPQKTAFLSEPMKWLDALVTDGRLHHDGNPVLTWMIGNLTARKDANDNVFPRKEDDKSKNDGAVALIMALGRAMHKEHENIITYRSGDMYGKDAHADQQTIA